MPLEHATHWVLGPVPTVTSSNFPGVQLKQFEEPTSFVTQPLGQELQAVGSKLTSIGFPSSCQEYNMNVPMPQSKQTEELVKDHFPAAQSEQNPLPSKEVPIHILVGSYFFEVKWYVIYIYIVCII